MATVYVVKVKGHPEYQSMTTAAESLASATNLYRSTYSIPDDLVEEITLFDCNTGTEYDVFIKHE